MRSESQGLQDVKRRNFNEFKAQDNGDSVVDGLFCVRFAQSETGSVSGTITDSSGAVVPGAQVTVTSVGTLAARTVKTNSTGAYSVTNLSPALYELKVSSQGFGDFKQRFTISPGGRSNVDATLAAKGTETVVEVTEHAETETDVQSSSMSQVVNELRVSQLPSLTRNPYDFVQTMGMSTRIRLQEPVD